MYLTKCDELDYVLLPRQQPDNDIFKRGFWLDLYCPEEARFKTMTNLISQRAGGVVLLLFKLCLNTASLSLSLETVCLLFD